MSIRKWESVLEKHIEGFFNKKFASDLQLAEIEKYLEREMQLKKKKIGQDYYLPNSYFFYIGQEDYERLAAMELEDKLYGSALYQTIQQDCLIDEKLMVALRRDTGLEKGHCEVKSFYQAIKEHEDEEVIKPLPEHTIIAEQSPKVLNTVLPSEHKIASLTVLKGPDKDSYLEITERQVHIGRREKNEFLLTDKNASRLHAYIAFEQCRHIIYDAGSLNGTYVNGEKIMQYRLKYGDEIQIGNTTILYEVI